MLSLSLISSRRASSSLLSSSTLSTLSTISLSSKLSLSSCILSSKSFCLVNHRRSFSNLSSHNNNNNNNNSNNSNNGIKSNGDMDSDYISISNSLVSPHACRKLFLHQNNHIDNSNNHNHNINNNNNNTSNNHYSYSNSNDDYNALKWYSCGPTVYEASHIGHARCYVNTDILRRIMSDYFHLNIHYAMGITDVDDKIIIKSQELGYKSLTQVNSMVRRLESDFFRDLDRLNVRRPDAVLRVSEHIPQIIAYIQGIAKNGYAYTTDEGVYFDVTRLGNEYGKLGGVSLSAFASTTANSSPELASSSQANHANNDDNGDISASQNGVEADAAHGKRDWRDFALWKAVKSSDGVVTWDSPWGFGRPGWHIECSAMTHSYFGEKLHLHSGGIDLKFPHHTNEIAQCEAHNGTKHWVDIWLHVGHLYIDGLKMSKSLKNFITIQDFFNNGYSKNPSVDFRLLCLQQHYTSAMHFSKERLQEAAVVRDKLSSFFHLYRATVPRLLFANAASTETSQVNPLIGAPCKPTIASMKLLEQIRNARVEIDRHLREDFNTPPILIILVSLASSASQYTTQVILQRQQLEAATITANFNDPISVEALDELRKFLLPLEPLVAVKTQLDSTLQLFGFDTTRDFDSMCSTVTSSDQVTDGKLGGNSSEAISLLCSFRQQVRNATLHAMKSSNAYIKKQKKKSSSDDSQSEPVQADNELNQVLINLNRDLQAIMQASDWVRAEATPKLGVKIDDIGGECSWRPVK